MTEDKKLADEIKAAVEKVNVLVSAACRQGLHVSFSEETMKTVRGSRPVIVVEITKKL